ncbi:hypothetical protein JOM56_004277 [Amanita muscaria]
MVRGRASKARQLIVKQRLLGKGRKPTAFDIEDAIHMALVLKLVADIASEGPHSHLFHVPAENEHYLYALQEDSVLMKLVGECYTSGSYKDVRCHVLRKNPTSAFTQNSGEEDKLADISPSHSATEKAWNEKYVGSAADCLYDTIKGHCARGDPVVYARYASIIQSSGMGKSRMIDELSKKHLVLPINLRPSSDNGFPAADVNVRTFFTVDESERITSFADATHSSLPCSLLREATCRILIST